MFSEEKRKNILKAWNLFMENKPIENCDIRKEILDSWERSRKYGVSWNYMDKKVLDEKSFKKKIEANKQMYEIASSMMEIIYNTVKNSGFIVLLCDADGYILKVIGDEDAVEKARNNLLVEGANRSEQAIGTCLYLDAPIQVWADEHYYIPHRIWTCSAAPIHDINGKLIGCINLSGPWDKVHLHTLGMVVAGASAIERQMEIQSAYDKLYHVNNELKAIIESIPYGAILLDANGNITHINSLAVSMLKLRDLDVIGKDIDRIIKYDKKIINFKNIISNVYDKEVLLETEKGSIRCSISATIAKVGENNGNFTILTLQETKFVHKLVNKTTASHAKYTLDDIIGCSKKIENTKRLARIAARSSSTVLLLGESGTGKELFAQSIHSYSSRCNKPFVAINCGSLPRGLIESELFGYEGGSFTGAKKEGQPGKFELANGGTIFLDEIGDMPLDVQVTLLRVLENKEVMRIGGTKTIKIDVRVIAATNRNLEELVENKSFRSDLYYRLNVFTINIPPLRDRKEDIKLLANHFLSKHKYKIQKGLKGFTAEVYEVLMSYDWPGNVRELENVIERAVNVAEGELITIEDLPAKLIESYDKLDMRKNQPIKEMAKDNFNKTFGSLSLKDVERQTIIEALKINKGNVKKASEYLGIGRRTMYRKFNEYGIDHTQYRE